MVCGPDGSFSVEDRMPLVFCGLQETLASRVADGPQPNRKRIPGISLISACPIHDLSSRFQLLCHVGALACPFWASGRILIHPTPAKPAWTSGCAKVVDPSLRPALAARRILFPLSFRSHPPCLIRLRPIPAARLFTFRIPSSGAGSCPLLQNFLQGREHLGLKICPHRPADSAGTRFLARPRACPCVTVFLLRPHPLNAVIAERAGNKGRQASSVCRVWPLADTARADGSRSPDIETSWFLPDNDGGNGFVRANQQPCSRPWLERSFSNAPSWDMGLKVGHSGTSVDEAVSGAPQRTMQSKTSD